MDKKIVGWDSDERTLPTDDRHQQSTIDVLARHQPRGYIYCDQLYDPLLNGPCDCGRIIENILC